MSFPVKSAIKGGINGSYKLQSQSCLTNPVPPVLATPSSTHPVSSTVTSLCNNSSTEMATTTTGQRQSSVEEDVISIDSASAAASHLIDVNTGQPITLSKKAIHQRDADENLFLRFLELDPPTADNAASQRRMSTFKPALGRTPFTITKRLTRTVEKGFGFSMVWTHPPRVEKVEPGLSADKNGILPGDYVIFVDKHNVVTMPEADVLNLIRSHGNALTLEIFRRSPSSGVPALSASRSTVVNGIPKSRVTSVASNYTTEEMSPAIKPPVGLGPRSSTACSNASMETTKRRLHLPQVTFSKESIAPVYGVEDHRRRFLLQLVSREQNFVAALHFGMQRFVTPLLERKDLISPHDHRTLFQNIDELLRISEDILEQLMQDDQEPQLNFASRVYLSKTTAICAAYKKYCNGIKRGDCVLVNKSRQPGSEFVSFITEPQVPRKRPDLTMFIHRPLQHFREILKMMQLLSSHCHVDSEEHKNFTTVINELQAAYREITVGGGLMEPLGEGRPLLTLQDLEARMVFTRCKPFTLAVQGRQWIFGGDLSRVEGRSVKPYWTLLFSDIIVFAKVSRDRVLFITEEPLPIANVVDSCFNIRKKTTEFRITVDPNGRLAESPTGYCAPDLTRTPKRNARRKTLVLRAPSLELKAVWQNLLQRQIFLVNAALGSTPLSSPLDSPDVLNTLVPLSDIGATTTSMASIKLSSMDSINLKNQQQVRLRSKNLQFPGSFENLQKLTTTLLPTTHIATTTAAATSTISLHSVLNANRPILGNSQLTLRTNQSASSSPWLSLSGSSINSSNIQAVPTGTSDNQTSSMSLTAIPETISEVPELAPNDEQSVSARTSGLSQIRCTSLVYTSTITSQPIRPFLEFSLSSVGRSFIDETDEGEDHSTDPSVPTPESPTPNISPSSSSNRCLSDTFSNDFVTLQPPSTPSVIVSPLCEETEKAFGSEDEKSGTASGSEESVLLTQRLPLGQYGGSWDLLELDLDFHEVNFDPSYCTDVEECVFMGDDPFGILPCRPTPPDSLDL